MNKYNKPWHRNRNFNHGNQSTKQSGENPETYPKKNSGAINKGYEYEHLITALITLRLLLEKHVKYFTLRLNSERFRKFDDLVLNITYENEREEQFAIQLKHREKGRDELHAETEFCAKEDLRKNKQKAFVIAQYVKAYEDQKQKFSNNCKLILLTNASFKDTETVTKYNVKKVPSPFPVVLNDSEKIFQFEENQTDCYSRKKSFYNNFYCLTDEKNVHKCTEAIKRIFREQFHSNDLAAIGFIDFFRELLYENFETSETSSAEVILILLKLRLSKSIILPLNTGKTNTNHDLVEEVVKKFELVCLSEDKKTLIQNKWNYKSNTESELIQIAKRMKLLEKENDEITDELVIKVEYSLKNGVLFLKVTPKSHDVITAMAPFLKTLNLTVVLIGKIETDLFKEWRVFQNLADLKKVDADLHEKFSRCFKISFQGRQPETLESLTQTFHLDLDQCITADEVVQFLEGEVVIGDKIEDLPEFYISRKLIKSDINFSQLNTLSREKTTVVHCQGKSKDLKQVFQEKKLNCKILEAIPESTPQTLILTDDDRIPDHNSYHLTFQDDNTFKWCHQEVDTTTNGIYENHRNFLIGEPGIGKTTFLKSLIHKCPPNFWTVFVPLHQIKTFSGEAEDWIREIMKINNINDFFCEYLMREQRIIFFFDSFNELNLKKKNKAHQLISAISKGGYKIWVSFIPHLKHRMVTRLKTAHVYVVKELMVDQQKNYIENRLKQANFTTEEINEVIKQRFEGSLDNDILKMPLTLSILTDLTQYFQNKKLDEAFNVNEMYNMFMNGKLKYFLNKSKLDHLDEEHHIVQVLKHFYLSNYQLAALHVCLEPNILTTLKVNEVDDFFKKSINEHDDFVQVLRVNDDDTFSFAHYTFAEYFAAMWLMDNFTSVPEDKRTFIFESRYEGIRKFFDYKLAKDCPLHLAVLDENVTNVKVLAEKHLQDTDKGGRTALHLAVSLGRKYETHNVKRTNTNIKKDFNKQEEILKYLLSLNGTNLLEKDELFGWNLFEYANAPLCLFALEELEKRLQMYWYYKRALFAISYHCVVNGYYHLLKNLVESHGLKNVNELHLKKPLLYLAIENNQMEIAEYLLTHKMRSDNNFDSQNRTALHIAVICGNYNMVERLVENVYIEAKDNLGRTALHYAAKMGHIEIVRLLQKNQANINARDNERKTPLHKAAYAGKEKVVEFLIEKGADINAVTSSNGSALHRAAEVGHLNTVKLLVTKGADKEIRDNRKMTPLHYAVVEGFQDVVKYLIDEKVNIFAYEEGGRTARELANDRKNTLIEEMLEKAEENDPRRHTHNQPGNELHKAVRNGNLKSVKRLTNTMNIEEINSRKETILHVAAYKGHVEIVKHLLKKGANTGARNEYNQVPLHCACSRGHVEVVKLLLNKGENEATDGRKITPLQWAAYKGHTKVVEVLANAGVDLNPMIESGRVPLHSAAHHGHNEVIEFLLSKGADIYKRTNKGKTCLHVAVQKRRYETVEFLLEKEKKLINEVDIEGNSPLHFANWKKDKKMIDILLKTGADRKMENNDHQAAL